MDWLDRYTDPDSGWTDWAKVHRGDGRSVVTDRRCILAVDDATAPFGELNLHPTRGAMNATARKVLAEPAPADAMAADLRDLWLWLDRIDRERCGACNGTGSYPGEWNDSPPDCEVCEGRGWHFPDAEFDAHTVSVLGHHFDRLRLAWWLAGELEGAGDSSPVRLWVAATFRQFKTQTLVIDGGWWRLVVASLNPERREGNRYRTYFPGAGLWWSCRRCPTARMAAIDWFQDRGVAADEVTLFGGEA